MLQLNNLPFIIKNLLSKTIVFLLFFSLNGVFGQCPLDLNETTIAPTNDMILHLPLDGNLTNLGSGAYTMNLSGATYTPTQCGQGLLFDGVDDYVTVSPSMNLVNDFTVTAWINPNAQVDWMGIFSIREQCASTYRGYSIAQFGLGDYNINTLSNQINKHQNCTGWSGGDRYTDPSIVIPNNEETFVALTVQNNSSENRQVYLYVNCQEFSTIMTIDMTTNVCFSGAINYITTIGASSNVSGQSSTFDGTIDEVRVYDRVLSNDELLDVYQSCLPVSMDVSNFSGCLSDSAQITLYNTELNVNYQLINVTSNTPVGGIQPGNCGPIIFSTGVVTDTTSFQIEAVNTISNCSVTIDTTITIFPSSNEYNTSDNIDLCFGDSTLINNQYISTSGTYIDTINLSQFCDSIITYTVNVSPQISIDLGADFDICPNDTVVLYSNYPNLQNLWSDGSTADSLVVSQSGNYWVDVTDTCGYIYSDSVNVQEISIPVNLGNDTLLCDGAQLNLDATVSITSTYLWSTGATNPSINVSSADTYWVVVSNQGCSNSDTINVSTDSIPAFSLPPDTSICSGTSLTLSSPIQNAQLLWSTGATSNTINISQADTYSLTATNSCGTFSDSIDVDVISFPVDLGNDTLLCDGAQLNLDATVSITSTYLWSTGATNPSINVSSADTYWVVVSNQGCSNSDTINVSTDSIPAFSLPPDTSICSGTSLTLSSPIQNAQLLWSTGATSNTINISQADTYSLTATNSCGTFSDSIDVGVNQSPEVNLGSDTSICEGETLILSTNVPNASTSWQDGSTSNTFSVSEPGVYYVEVIENNCPDYDTINIQVSPLPSVQLGKDTSICLGDYFAISAEGIGDSYLWNNGSSSQSILVSKPGKYSVTVNNECGIASDEIEISVNNCFCEIYIPNAFTPDDNNFNETFKLILDCPIDDFELLIFNRWGEVIFESNSIEDDWDSFYKGKKVKTGTYIYQVRYKVTGQERKVVVGHVTVLY